MSRAAHESRQGRRLSSRVVGRETNGRRARESRASITQRRPGLTCHDMEVQVRLKHVRYSSSHQGRREEYGTKKGTVLDDMLAFESMATQTIALRKGTTTWKYLSMLRRTCGHAGATLCTPNPLKRSTAICEYVHTSNDRPIEETTHLLLFILGVLRDECREDRADAPLVEVLLERLLHTNVEVVELCSERRVHG